ncbi:MAG: ABC transporter permease [Clostridiaceae bacterium]|jgi:ABC-2 type transport system permease protein|nr:ABC transporter permease [Clostridiaceae bacterium]
MNLKIISALVKKEALQILRDPSTTIIAFVLPLMMLLLFMYGLNLDTPKVSLGLKIDDDTPQISNLIQSFNSSKYVRAKVYEDKDLMYKDISASKINGAVIIPNDFSKNLEKGDTASMLIITDGSYVNTANYVQSYPVAIANNWLSQSSYKTYLKPPVISANTRMWYNQDINSHYFILPGSFAITLNLVGLLLTALVIAREWERGTMESLLGTRVGKLDIILGKYIPYFILGILSLLFNVFLCIFVFKIPFHGSFVILFSVSALFLLTAIGIGLLISTIFKNQFLASQMSLGVGFLPALLLSGLMFPINSMPMFFQFLTMILPPRYYVTFIESEFMAGTIKNIVLINTIYLSILAILLFIAVYEKTSIRLEEGGK